MYYHPPVQLSEKVCKSYANITVKTVSIAILNENELISKNIADFDGIMDHLTLQSHPINS